MTPISTCSWILRYSSARERARSLEHVVIDTNLADVVEQTGQVQIARSGRHSQLFRQSHGDPGHALECPTCGVFGVDRGGKARMIPKSKSFNSADLGVAGLGGDQRRHVPHPFDFRAADQSILKRVDDDQPASTAGAIP